MEDKAAQLNGLTPADKKVLNQLHRGAVRTQDIAANLGIDQRAVRQALGHMRQILGVESREALLEVAERLGFQFDKPAS